MILLENEASTRVLEGGSLLLEQFRVASPVERAISELHAEFNDKSIPYFLIGSIARKTFMGEEIDDKKEIDFLLPARDSRIDAANIVDDLRLKHPLVIFDMSLSEFLQQEADGSYFLRKGNIRKALDASIIQPVQLKTIGANVEFTTIPPETLLHTFLITASKFRSKDWKNSLAFSGWVKKNVDYEHKKLEPFHEFAHDQWSQSPLRKLQFKWRQIVKDLPEPVKDVLLSRLYNRGIVKSARQLFNSLENLTCGVAQKK